MPMYRFKIKAQGVLVSEQETVSQRRSLEESDKLPIPMCGCRLTRRNRILTRSLNDSKYRFVLMKLGIDVRPNRATQWLGVKSGATCASDLRRPPRGRL